MKVELSKKEKNDLLRIEMAKKVKQIRKVDLNEPDVKLYNNLKSNFSNEMKWLFSPDYNEVIKVNSKVRKLDFNL